MMSIVTMWPIIIPGEDGGRRAVMIGFKYGARVSCEWSLLGKANVSYAARSALRDPRKRPVNRHIHVAADGGPPTTPLRLMDSFVSEMFGRPNGF